MLTYRMSYKRYSEETGEGTGEGEERQFTRHLSFLRTPGQKSSLRERSSQSVRFSELLERGSALVFG